MQQLSMFDILEPPPAPVKWIDPPKREVMTRAYGDNTRMFVPEGVSDPIEIEVRGVPSVIEFSFGFNTYAVLPPGSLFWSETGFRSWTNGVWQEGRGIIFDGTVDDIQGLIEAYIDLPVKKMGCGGKLIRWWPSYVRQWRDELSWSIRYPRDEMWTQWGPERHAEMWAAHDLRIAEAEARMWAEGIDPNDVGPPAHHKGPWPRFEKEDA